MINKHNDARVHINNKIRGIMRVVITNNNNEIHTTENELITQEEEETIKQIRSLVAPSVKQIVNEF